MKRLFLSLLILQMETEMRHREGECLAEGHTASGELSGD